MNADPQRKDCPPHPLGDDRTKLEKDCKVQDLVSIQRKYNSRRRGISRYVHIGNPVIDSQNAPTLEYWPDEYFYSEMLFQNITSGVRLKYMADFVYLLRVKIFRESNHLFDLRSQVFPLAQSQGGDQLQDAFIINPLKNELKVRCLIIKMDTSCEFIQNPLAIQPNKKLEIDNVFEDNNDIITSPIKKAYTVIEDQCFSFSCQGCDSEEKICFKWNINKDTCITNVSGQLGAGDRNVRLLNGYYWFVVVNNIDEPFRFIRHSSYVGNEGQRYLVGTHFNPFNFIRGPCAVVLESLHQYRYLNLDGNNPMAVEEFNALKKEIFKLRKAVEGANIEEPKDEEIILRVPLNVRRIEKPECRKRTWCEIQCEDHCGACDRGTCKKPRIGQDEL